MSGSSAGGSGEYFFSEGTSEQFDVVLSYEVQYVNAHDEPVNPAGCSNCWSCFFGDPLKGLSVLSSIPSDGSALVYVYGNGSEPLITLRLSHGQFGKLSIKNASDGLPITEEQQEQIEPWVRKLTTAFDSSGYIKDIPSNAEVRGVLLKASKTASPADSPVAKL